MIIHHLPPALRYTRKYKISVRLWFGYTKPIFSTFMQPFIEIMQQLYHDGFSVKIPSEDKLLTVRGITISSSMDAPAKCLFMWMQQFSGRCRSSYCTTSGTDVFALKRGNCRTYPYVRKQIVQKICKQEHTSKHFEMFQWQGSKNSLAKKSWGEWIWWIKNWFWTSRLWCHQGNKYRRYTQFVLESYGCLCHAF